MGAQAFTSPEIHLEVLFPGNTPVTSTSYRISQEAVFIPDSLNAETLQKVLLMEVWACLGKQRRGGGTGASQSQETITIFRAERIRVAANVSRAHKELGPWRRAAQGLLSWRGVAAAGDLALTLGRSSERLPNLPKNSLPGHLLVSPSG